MASTSTRCRSNTSTAVRCRPVQLPQANSEAITFRGAEPADVVGIVALVNEAYRAPTADNAWTSEATLIAGARIDTSAVQHLLAEADSVLIVGEHAGAVVACIHVSRDEQEAHIGLFAVARAWQGRGLGRRLLAHAEAVAQDMGARRAAMRVVTQRADLIAFYERCGYRRTGEVGAYPVGEGVGTPRVPGLTVEALTKALTPVRSDAGKR